MSTMSRHTGSESRVGSIPRESVFDYVALSEALSKYQSPRDRITRLIRNGQIIRLKKGLYCRPDALSADGIRVGVIANLLYGPSYVSLQSALAAYGMIPEAVVHVTSVTTGKAKRYDTPLGTYLYRSVPAGYYWRGVQFAGDEPFRRYLCASREKALADIVYFTPGLETERDVRSFLFDDIRIDEDALSRLDADAFSNIAAGVERQSLRVCSRFIGEIAR